MGYGLLTEPILVPPTPHEIADTLISNDEGQATRFLQRATFGPRPGDVEHLQTVGVERWLTEQVEMKSGPGHVDMMLSDPNYRMQSTVWQAFLDSEDQLRRRVGYALSQIFVVSDRSVGSDAVAGYADLLNRHAFGNFRDLLEAVTLSPAMGRYLSHHQNNRANPATGQMPDENFAREVMQLFTIGLWELNKDGTRRTRDGEPIPTYDINDVMGLARVFTGWENQSSEVSRWFAKPMIVWQPTSRWHEHGEKRFLGKVIAPGIGAVDSLRIALDVLFEHPNTAPFICRQLIQRMVTSNPSAGYVRRIVEVFDSDANSERGNLAAVVRAILMDEEAINGPSDGSFGKIREPVLRFSTVMRMMDIRSSSTPWMLGDLSHPAKAIGQQPYLAPSVFNFYRPGFVPDSKPFADEGLVSPEMQIVTEASSIGWINKLARTMKWPPPGLSFNIGELTDIADSPDGLVAEVSSRLCPDRMSTPTRAKIVQTVERVRDGNPQTQREERVMAAVLLSAASTDFIYER